MTTVRLDPQSGPGHLQVVNPALSHNDAQTYFWKFHSIGTREHLVADADKVLYAAYLQWLTFRGLTL